VLGVDYQSKCVFDAKLEPLESLSTDHLRDNTVKGKEVPLRFSQETVRDTKGVGVLDLKLPTGSEKCGSFAEALVFYPTHCLNGNRDSLGEQEMALGLVLSGPAKGFLDEGMNAHPGTSGTPN
jgi:hypothetical protein